MASEHKRGGSQSAFLTIAGWSMIGATVAGTATFVALFVPYHGVMLGPHDTDEIQAWTWFTVVMASAGAALIGLIAGVIYGFVCVRRNTNKAAP